MSTARDRKFDYEQAAQMRRDGLTFREVSEKLGVKVVTIQAAMNRYYSDDKSIMARRYSAKSAEKHDAILKLRELGDEGSVIAYKLGLTLSQVNYSLRTLGTDGDHRQQGEKSPKRKAARILKQAGLTYDEIGTAFGFSRQRAQQLVRPTQFELEKFHKEHGNKCDRCGATDVKLDADHSDYSTGPTELLCVVCHRKKHNHLTEYLAQKQAA